MESTYGDEARPKADHKLMGEPVSIGTPNCALRLTLCLKYTIMTAVYFSQFRMLAKLLSLFISTQLKSSDLTVKTFQFYLICESESVLV